VHLRQVGDRKMGQSPRLACVSRLANQLWMRMIRAPSEQDSVARSMRQPTEECRRAEDAAGLRAQRGCRGPLTGPDCDTGERQRRDGRCELRASCQWASHASTNNQRKPARASRRDSADGDGDGGSED
jgi:hypothetical protein